MHDQHQPRGRELRDRREIVDRVVGQLRQQRRVDRVLVVGHEQRVAVGVGLRGQLGCKHAGRAGAVIDDELLFQVLRQPRAEKPREKVCRAARRRRREEAYRARWIVRDVVLGLRHCRRGCGPERRARGERGDDAD
jgi:hypothetical protein